MDKERNIHELLILLKEEAIFTEKNEVFYGLCVDSYGLAGKGIITGHEHVILNLYLEENLPLRKKGSAYCWKQGELKPRIEWLDLHIKSTTPKN